MNYRLSQAADQDLYTLYLQGISQHGLSLADEYYDELVDTLDLLAQHPEMARIHPELDPPLRVHPHREHIILYDFVEGADIFIVRIRNRREDWRNFPN